MSSVASCCDNPADKFNLARADWAYQSARIAKAEIAGEQSTNIEIQTADGDKVTLSSDFTFESSALVYEKLGQTPARYGRSQGQIITANASSKLELTVEGTLDEQEKKDIKAVLLNVFKMVKDFLSGNAVAGTKEAQNFTDLTTIAKVSAAVDIRTEVMIAAQSATRYVTRTSVEDKPAIPEAETPNPPAVSGRVDKLTDRMIGLVKDSGVEPAKILRYLNRRLAWFSRNFTKSGPGGRHKMRLLQEIMEDFAKKVRRLSAEKEAGINKELADAVRAADADDFTVSETTASFTETKLDAAGQDFLFEMEYSVADDDQS